MEPARWPRKTGGGARDAHRLAEVLRGEDFCFRPGRPMEGRAPPARSPAGLTMWPAVCSRSRTPHAARTSRQHRRGLGRSVAGNSLVRARGHRTGRARSTRPDETGGHDQRHRTRLPAPEQPVVRDARSEEIAARFAGIAPSTVAVGLVLETPSPGARQRRARIRARTVRHRSARSSDRPHRVGLGARRCGGYRAPARGARAARSERRATTRCSAGAVSRISRKSGRSKAPGFELMDVGVTFARTLRGPIDAGRPRGPDDPPVDRRRHRADRARRWSASRGAAATSPIRPTTPARVRELRSALVVEQPSRPRRRRSSSACSTAGRRAT